MQNIGARGGLALALTFVAPAWAGSGGGLHLRCAPELMARRDGRIIVTEAAARTLLEGLIKQNLFIVPAWLEAHAAEFGRVAEGTFGRPVAPAEFFRAYRKKFGSWRRFAAKTLAGRPKDPFEVIYLSPHGAPPPPAPAVAKLAAAPVAPTADALDQCETSRAPVKAVTESIAPPQSEVPKRKRLRRLRIKDVPRLGADDALDVRLIVHLLQLLGPSMGGGEFREFVSNPEVERVSSEQLGVAISPKQLYEQCRLHFDHLAAALEYAGYAAEPVLPTRKLESRTRVVPFRPVARETVAKLIRALAREVDLSPDAFLLESAEVQRISLAEIGLDLSAMEVWFLVKRDHRSWLAGLSAILPDFILDRNDFEHPAGWVVRMPLAAAESSPAKHIIESAGYAAREPGIVALLRDYQRRRHNLSSGKKLLDAINSSSLSAASLLTLSQWLAPRL